VTQLSLVPEPEDFSSGDRDPLLAQVVFEESVGYLDYRVDPDQADDLKVGMAVLVRLRGRQTTAYICRLGRWPVAPKVKLKSIVGRDILRPDLPEDLLTLVIFAADYYRARPSDMLTAALPSVARRGTIRFKLSQRGIGVHVQELDELGQGVMLYAREHPQGFAARTLAAHLIIKQTKLNSRLRSWVQKGWLEQERSNKGPRKLTAYRRHRESSLDDFGPREKAAKAIWEQLSTEDYTLATEIARNNSRAYALLKRLESRCLIEKDTKVQRQRVPGGMEEDAQRWALNDEQAAALTYLEKCLGEDEGKTTVLEGVTGSGKTEVYLRLIETALNMGSSALVLVPEIALTPQLGARFRSRFGGKVATFHSGLSVAQRRDEWERVHTGEAVIGLGARSALFLPMRNLGVIVVDEEHESSFKQEESPRYNARDMAVVRGKMAKALVVLGSATPSLESRRNADIKKFGHLRLVHRVLNRPMPEVQCVDMTATQRVGEGIFSQPLAEAVEKTLARQEQVILFLNRRGFAPYVFCRDCGSPFRCQECDVSLTLHRGRDQLLCHYCGYFQRVPEVCPQCHGFHLEGHGLGTERLEVELRELMGEVSVVRLDRDTVRSRGALHERLDMFRRGDAKVLIGTQMVTKGHDFPGVTLVGVMAADASLNFPDFRSAERTFQLLTQVAGRAGRGELGGQVLVQAYETNHYAIASALGHDYERFVETEYEARRELMYPPFSHLVLIRLQGEDQDRVSAAAQEVGARLRTLNQEGNVSVLGPVPAPLARLKGLWRHHILLKAAQRQPLRNMLQRWKPPSDESVRVVVDIDPLSML
jgi:primosomal protein N' (replication factor Y) (superfamily II helicase)